jgi:hypothetical protein
MTMRIELDHTIVPSRDKLAAARQLAGLLGVAWAETTAGLFRRCSSTTG